MSTGRLSQLGAAMESAWGTLAAPALFEDRTTTLTLDQKVAVDYPPHISVGNRLQTRNRRGRTVIAGRIAFDAGRDSILGMCLRSAFGGITTTVVASIGGYLYKHTFTMISSTHLPSMTIEVDRGTIQSNRFGGCRINELTLSLDPDPMAVLMADVDIIGKTRVTTTKAAATFPTPDAFPRTGFKVYVDSAEDTLTRSFRCTFRNLLNAIDTSGEGADLGALRAQGFEVEGQFVRVFDDTLRRADFWAGTKRRLAFQFDTTSYQCLAIVPSADFSDVDEPPVEGTMEETVSFRGIYLSTEGVQVQLTDVTSGY